MSASERKLMSLIIAEREERSKDVEELRAKLAETAADLRAQLAEAYSKGVEEMRAEWAEAAADLRAQLAEACGGAGRDTPPQPGEALERVPSKSSRGASSLVLEDEQCELDSARIAASDEPAQFAIDRALEALKASLQQTELDMRMVIGRRSSLTIGTLGLVVEGLADNISRLRRNLIEVKLDWKALAEASASDAAVSRQASSNSGLEASGRRRSTGSAPPAVAEAAEGSGSQVVGLEAEMRRQSQELLSFRRVLAQLCAGVPLQAVRATRNALRCVELSEEDRMEALGDLSLKEKQLLSEIKQIEQSCSLPEESGPRLAPAGEHRRKIGDESKGGETFLSSYFAEEDDLLASDILSM